MDDRDQGSSECTSGSKKGKGGTMVVGENLVLSLPSDCQVRVFVWELWDPIISAEGLPRAGQGARAAIGRDGRAKTQG